MCMKLSLFARKRVASQDIVCYKVVGQFPGSQALQAFYYDFIYEINKGYTGQLVREGMEVEKRLSLLQGYQICHAVP